QHDAFVALPVLADRDRLQYLGKMFDLPIDFGGADAYAAGIQRGVGTTVDDDPVVRGEFGPVAVAPHAGYLGEIGRTVFLAFWIIPELHGHRRERRGTSQFARLFAHRLAGIIENLDLHAEPAALQFAAIHRQHGIAERETGDDVGAARDRGQQHAFLHITVDVVKTFRRQRRTGRENGFQAGEFVRLARLHAHFGGGVDPFGAGAEDAD